MASHLSQTHRARQDTAWLSMLVDAMEKVSGFNRSEFPCDEATLAGFAMQLARPAPSATGSAYSLRN
jgi:hypothetical protein